MADYAQLKEWKSSAQERLVGGFISCLTATGQIQALAEDDDSLRTENFLQKYNIGSGLLLQSLREKSQCKKMFYFKYLIFRFTSLSWPY